MDTQAEFLARTSAGTVAIDSSGIRFLGREGGSSAIVFDGVSRRAGTPEQPLKGLSHYIQHRDPARWVWNVPHYGAVRFHAVYPGIDLLYRASRNGVEFDFLLDGAADPSRVRFRVPSDASIDNSGALVLRGTRLQLPLAWQTMDGKRVPVAARFAFDRRHPAHFQLGEYDSHFPLTIDPLVQFATFLGGSNNDIGIRVISGSDGAIYTAGNTISANFPATLSPGNALERPDLLLQQTVYIARIEPDASTLDWSLFIGGTARQSVFALKQDTFGNLYLLGGTTSPNFPVTAGALRTTIDPSMTDLFLVKLDAQTGQIKTSTFLGIALYVNQLDAGAALAIDPAEGIYIGGYRLYSGAFVPTSGAFDTTTLSSYFVMRLNAAISAAVYATYWPLGSITAMDVDATGNLTIGGAASSAPFSAVNPLPGVNQTPSSLGQAYIARLNPTGTAVAFATLLNGGAHDSGISDLKIVSDGSTYVSGWTSGTQFPQVNPLTLDPFTIYQTVPSDSTDSPFLARLAADGRSLIQSTLFSGAPYTAPGGTVLNTNLRLAFQPNGFPCLAGLNMPTTQQTAGGLVPDPNIGPPAFGMWSLSCEDPTGSRISMRTDLPQSNGLGYTDIAATADGAFLFTGGAGSALATTPNVVQPRFGGSYPYSWYPGSSQIYPGDAFLMRVTLDNPAPNLQGVSPNYYVLDNSAPSNLCSGSIAGSGFAYGAAITVNGQAATYYTFSDSGHGTFLFACNSLEAGDNPIVMNLPPPGGGVSQGKITALNAPPLTISVSPSSLAQGSPESKIVIRATNLSAGSVLYWNGSPRTASYVQDAAPLTTGHFELLLEPPELAQPFTAQVTVSNPAPGGGLSPTAFFGVQPATGFAAPSLLVHQPLLYAPGALPGPQILFVGSGFTPSTEAFWDGAEVPASLNSATIISIQPPPSDLSHLGVHDLYVTNGALRSASIRILVGQALGSNASAYDPLLKRLYVLTTPTFNGPPADLLVFDGTTGNLVTTLKGIVQFPTAAVLSADGSYLYIAAANTGALATILRYDTVSGAVDLQWQLAALPGQTTSNINSIVTPTGAPETLIVSSNEGQVLIFDGNRQRPYDSISAGFPITSGYPLLFASGNRIYGGVPGGTCSIWLDFDSFGISGGQSSCATQLPDTQQDSGVTYLSDGARVSVLSLPSGLLYGALSLAADLNGRHAWALGSSDSGIFQLVEYSMDAQQWQLKGQSIGGSSQGYTSLYPAGNDTVLVVTPSYLLLVP